MPPAKGLIGIPTVTLLALTLLLSPPLAAQEAQPPLEVVAIDVNPEEGGITNQTTTVNFTADIQNNDGYTGESTVTFNLSGDTIAETPLDWSFPLTQEEQTADSRDDPERDGEWEPTIGDHTLNVTVHDDEDTPLHWQERSLLLGPDLTIQTPTASPSDPVEGETVDIAFTVTNQGPWATPTNETINITLLSPQGQTVDDATVQNLEPDDAHDVTFQWTAEPGETTLTLLVEDDIEEARTENNHATLNITADDANPHLIVSTIQALPNPASPGDRVAVQATLTNTGNAPTPETNTTLTLEGEEHTQRTDPIDADTSSNILWELTPEIGTHTLTVTADDDQKVTPAQDPDRSMTYNLTVGPDLAITDIQTIPDDPLSGDVVQFEATLENQGSALEDRVNLALFHEDDLLDDTLVDALAAGGTETITLGSWTATTGDHTFHVEADPDENINEATTENNNAALPLTVDPRPSIVTLGTPTLTQLDVDPGDPVSFEVTATNEGDLAAENLTLRFSVNDAPLSETFIRTLDPDETRTATSHEWTANEGAHTLTVRIGTADELRDDEPRDTTTLPFAIGPNLVPTGVELSPSQPRLGDTVSVNTTVENQGTQATGAFQIALNVDGTTVDEATLDDMPPRSTANIEHTWHVTDDAEELTVIVDVRGEVDEVDETNNQRTHNVTVDTDVPHLVATDLISDPENPVPGDNITFTVRIINQGAAAGSFDVTFLVENETLSTHTLRSLDTDAEELLTSDSWEAQEGTTNITVVVDPEHHIPQPTREDNEATLSLSVEEAHFLPAPGVGFTTLVAAAACLARSRRS